MARIGRPPKPDALRRTPPLNVRLPQDLRDRLEAEATENKQSLSAEIVARLEESFELGRKEFERFSGREWYWIFRTMAESVEAIERQTHGAAIRYQTKRVLIPNDPKRALKEDLFTFTQVRDCFNFLLDHLRPRGKSVVPKHFDSPLWTPEMKKTVGRRQAVSAWIALEMHMAQRDREHAPVARQLVPVFTRSPTATLFEKTWRRKAKTQRKAPK